MQFKIKVVKISLMAFAGVVLMIAMVGCRQTDTSKRGEGEKTYTFQSDWFAQPEYAGFYEAYVKGFYEEEGLKVEIVEGGPNADPLKRLLLRRADFINMRSDDAIVARARGLPVKFVGVTLQHNPQAILSRAENPITKFEQLDGKRVMVDVSAPWIDFIERKYGISINRMPHNFGLSHYLNDPEFIMQCFLTNEPYTVRQKGVEPVVLPMWESGFDSYRGIVVHEDFLAENPEVVRKFVEATRQGWESYLTSEEPAAHGLISERNPIMTADFMNFIKSQLVERSLVVDSGEIPDGIGVHDVRRLEEQIEILANLGVIDKKVAVDEVFSF